MRIVFMGTPDFAVPSLEMLVGEGYEVAAVVTQPDKPKGRGNKLTPQPVKEAALRMGIPVLQPLKVKTGEFAAELRNLAPDLVVTAAYGRILPAGVLEIPPMGCINVHGSLLPKYRGAAPIQWAIINGEVETGITTMYMDIGMDTGDILIKKAIKIEENITAEELFADLSELGAEVLRETVEGIRSGTLQRTPQNHAEATYAPMISKEMGLIDWSKSAREIHNLVRGTCPWPGAYTQYKGGRMRIWKTSVSDNEKEQGVPGKILKIEKSRLNVACGEGILGVSEIQFDAGRRMKLEQCWHNMDEGEVLG